MADFMADFTKMVSGILLDFGNVTMDQFKFLCQAKIRLWATQLTIVYFGTFTNLASTVKYYNSKDYFGMQNNNSFYRDLPKTLEHRNVKNNNDD